jgi:hypothetical protein
VPRGAIPEAMYEDSHNPYHYLRLDAGEKEDRLIIGGEDHRREIAIEPEKNYRALAEFTQELFPDLKLKEKHGGIGMSSSR